MWNKPSQLTSYPGLGFEILALGYGPLAAAVEDAVAKWMHSPAHRAVVLSQAPWGQSPWRALGCSLEAAGGAGARADASASWAAVCWFGRESG